jgi:hypothetical protein
MPKVASELGYCLRARLAADVLLREDQQHAGCISNIDHFRDPRGTCGELAISVHWKISPDTDENAPWVRLREQPSTLQGRESLPGELVLHALTTETQLAAILQKRKLQALVSEYQQCTTGQF